ncbi:hypothetical protein VNI00_016378 [Paramarasmius palmivorus]|uniref:Uncharacterized protein n=1 Tax=Paramarasmius palmivorus TaxID=297713 RepID=A0AAW0BDQ3_9AGAR
MLILLRGRMARRRGLTKFRPPRTHREFKVHIASFLMALIMLLLGSMHVSVDLYRILDAFIFQASIQTPNQTLSAINSRTFLAKVSIYYLQTLVGDGFWLYRTYVIWNNDKRIGAALLTFLLASAAIGIRVFDLYSHTSNIGDPIFASQNHAWAISYAMLTLTINVGSTVLIASRIWYTHRKAAQLFPETMQQPCRLPTVTFIVIESGAVYSTCLIILITLYLCGNYAQYIVNDAVRLY